MRDFLLYNSTYHYFDLETFVFAQNIQDFIIEESNFETATKVGNDPNPTILELGLLDEPTKSFKLINCTFGQFLEEKFVKVNSLSVEIKRNHFEASKKEVFSLKGEDIIFQGNNIVLPGSEISILLDGKNINFTENRIMGKNQNLIMMIPFNSLLLEENAIFENNYEVLELVFPETEISSLSIINSNLGRLTSVFLNVLVNSTIISGSTFSLDSKDIFLIETRNLILTNNTFLGIYTGAIKSNVLDSIVISNNSFQHLQRESFFFIEPVSNTTRISISDNIFENVENGFLKINPSSLQALQDGRLSFGQLNLKKSCSCAIAHDIIVPDKVSKLNHSNHEDEDHTSLENIIQDHIICISNGNPDSFI